MLVENKKKSLGDAREGFSVEDHKTAACYISTVTEEVPHKCTWGDAWNLEKNKWGQIVPHATACNYQNRYPILFENVHDTYKYHSIGKPLHI